MKKQISVLLALVMIFMLAACSISGNTGTAATSNEQASSVSSEAGSSSANAETSSESSSVSSAETVSGALAENSKTHEDESDYTWDSSEAVPITLNGDSIIADSSNVTVNGSTAAITAAGVYRLSGSLADGQIIVDTADEGTVQLILDGVDLVSSTSAPIYVKNAKKVVILLADGSSNTITDGSSYVFNSAEEDEPNAAVFAKSDLSIAGSGSLTVNANYNDGISSKDGLIIAGGVITVNAVDDGIRGKDYLVINDANLTINSQGDGLKSDNEEDAAKGYVNIQSGTLDITSGGDAITAQTDVLISGGSFTLTSGGGSSSQIDAALSAKGVKGVVSVVIDEGTFSISSADDAVHSNGSIIINAGSFEIASGDDGIHADTNLVINNGEIAINNSYEGLESTEITINEGNIHIQSSDDGINIAGGTDNSGFMQGPGFGGGRSGGGKGQGLMPGQNQGTVPGQDQGTIPVQPGTADQTTVTGEDTFSETGNYTLTINGGYVYVDANGDGLDSNGGIVMTGGTVLVNGPTENMNGALDYTTGFKISGGFFVAVGSAGMAMAPDTSSSQYSLLLNFDSALQAGTLIQIQNAAGETILAFTPTKTVQSIAFSSPDLANGTEYHALVGGSSTGTLADGLYKESTATGGTEYTSFTISTIVTQLGNMGMGGGKRP